MEKTLATLNDLAPADLKGSVFLAFEPSAQYYAPLDCVIFLQEDLPYRADRVDEFITILWHPTDDRTIGLKIKGFRFLFKMVQDILASAECEVPEAMFLPLMSAIQAAMSLRSASLMHAAETNRIEKQKQLTESYGRAAKIVGSHRLDVRQLERAA